MVRRHQLLAVVLCLSLAWPAMASDASSLAEGDALERLQAAVDAIPDRGAEADQILQGIDTVDAKAWRAYLAASGDLGAVDFVRARALFDQIASTGVEMLGPDPTSQTEPMSLLSDVLWRLRSSLQRSEALVPCWLFARHAEALDAFGPYWGSSLDIWPPLCPEMPISDLPAVAAFHEALDGLFGGFYSPELGTMRYLFLRDQQMEELRASYQPESALSDFDPETAARTFANLRSVWAGVPERAGTVDELMRLRAAAADATAQAYRRQGLNAEIAGKAAQAVVERYLSAVVDPTFEFGVEAEEE